MHQIAFCEYNDAAFDSKQAANFEVFTGLRLYALVGSNHKKNQVNARGTSEHVTHKFFVALNVHKAETHAGRFKKSEAKINRNSPAFFFFQPVGIRASQRLHE